MKTVSKKLLSLLLVAILLVSAIPFQAFAEAHTGANETIGKLDATQHCVYCAQDGCTDHSLGDWVRNEDHSFTISLDNAKDASCVEDGKETDMKCACGEIKVGATIPAAGSHSYISAGTPDATNHYVTCTNPKCEQYQQTIPVAHTFSSETGKCSCGIECTHSWTVTTAQVNPDCENPGTTAVETCQTCHMTRGGTEINALGHDLDALGRCKRTGCEYNQNDDSDYVSFVTEYGSFSSTSDVKFQVVQVKNNMLTGIPSLHNFTGYTFTGWRSNTGYVLEPNNISNVVYDKDRMGTIFTAQWSMDTVTVNLYAVKNGDYTHASFVKSYQVPKNTGLYNYMNDEARRQDVRNYDANVVGYKWDNEFRDRNGNTLNSGTPSEGQAVYVDLKVMSVKLFLDADGGRLNETEINTTYGSVVNLPIPTKENKVFGGWEDVTPGSTTNGSVFDRQFKITMETDMMLKAVWHDKAAVVLRVYLNGDFNSMPHLYEIGEYVVGGNVYYKDIESLLVSRYGGGITVNGLFNAADWAGFKNNPNQPRQNDIHLSENKNEITYVYVMLNGYNGTNYPTTPTTPTNPTVPANGFWVRDLNGNLIWYPAGSSLPAGSGYWILDANGNPNIWVITSGSIIPTYIYVGSNPKTGDTAQIEIAAAVMVLAAAALITVMALRKKKSV